MHNTWGISGPAFLAIYGGAIVLLALGAVLHRRVAFRGTPGADADELDPEQIAYVTGGPRLAACASLAALRAVGVVDAEGRDRLTTTAPLAADPTGLDRVVYAAAGRGVRASRLWRDPEVRAELTRMGHELAATGLVIAPPVHRALRLWGVAGLALGVLGVARIVAGIANDKPVGYLDPEVAAALFGSVLAATADRYTTTAARRPLITLRRQYGYLAPAQSPAMEAYGAVGAALGVALFGPAAFQAMDPAFVSVLGIQHVTGNSLTSTYTGDGGSTAGTNFSGGSGGGGGGGCGG
jgi:uncharacterized protein (TIGR04222 family)